MKPSVPALNDSREQVVLEKSGEEIPDGVIPHITAPELGDGDEKDETALPNTEPSDDEKKESQSRNTEKSSRSKDVGEKRFPKKDDGVITAGSSDTAIGVAHDVEKTSAGSQNPENETTWKRPISDTRWYMVTVGLLLGAVLYGLDTTIAADVQGPILKSLHDIEKLAWVGIGFPLGSVCVILLVGCCYGLFEIKKLMMIFVILFSVGSAICGAAQSMDMLIVGRVVAGVGGAGTYLGAMTYVSKFTSPKEQPIFNGLIGICWGGGTILGPLIGGGFSQSSLTWRWAFYINLPLTAAIGPIYIFAFPTYNPRPEIPGWEKFKSIDWVGVVLNAAVFALFQIVLTFAGSMYAWDSGATIALWAVFGVVLIAYAIQQVFCIFTTPDRRLFPVQFLKSRTLILLFTGTASATTAMVIGIFYTPIFFQFTRGDSAIQAAVRLLTFICLFVFSLLLSSASLPSYGRYQPLYFVSGILIIVGSALMHTVKASTSKSNIYGYQVLVAVGAGLVVQTAYSVGAVKVKTHEIPSVIGFMNVAQIGTAALALSIADCIFQNVGFIEVRNALSGYGFNAAQIRSALAGSESAVISGGNPTVAELAIGAIVDVIGKIWFMSIAAGGVILLGSFFMSREKLKLEVVAGG